MLTTIKLAAISFLLSAFSFAAPKNLDLGGMVLSLSDAPTAQTFHIVDQLSQWDIYTHDQYLRWAEATHFLDQGDKELLHQHAEMRKKRGWGHGFEQTFLVDDSIEDAAAKGIAAQFLSAAEANTERDILLHFAPKLEPLLRQRRVEIVALEQQLVAEQARLTPLMVQLAHFAEVTKTPTVLVFLVANSEDHNGGGGAMVEAERKAGAWSLRCPNSILSVHCCMNHCISCLTSKRTVFTRLPKQRKLTTSL
jgi:hypothetical protein